MSESSGLAWMVGEVLFLREQDYRWGVGGLRLRVTVPPVVVPGAEWATVTGVAVLWNGRDGDQVQVQVLVEVLQGPRIRGPR